MQQPLIQVDLRRTATGNIKAYADVTLPTALGEITLKGFRVVQRAGKAPWVGFPNNTYTKDGKTVTRDFLEAREAIQRQIADAVLAEYAVPRRPATRRVLDKEGGGDSPVRTRCRE